MRKAGVATRQEKAQIAALRAGDEGAFSELVDRFAPSMLRVAESFVRSRAVAEEVVQETWLGVLQGVDRFEERSSLKTWIFRILTNIAKTRGEREGRSKPFSSFAAEAADPGGPSYDPAAFFPPDHPTGAGTWRTPPRQWDDVPEDRLLSLETREVIARAIDELPPAQATVITLRDVEGLTADEVCNALEITETNQRVLLHRARSKVRGVLADYLDRG